MRKLATSFSLLLLAASAFAAEKVQIPDWFRQAAAQTLRTYPPDTDAVVLLDDTSYTVTSPGESIEHYRRVVKILRPNGRKYGYAMVNFRNNEKVNSIHAWSIDSSGREFEVKDKEIQERASCTESLYSDVRLRFATAPAAEPGSVIGFEYEVQRHEFFNELRWWIQEEIPVHQASLTVQLPPSFEYKDLWANTTPEKAVSIGSNRWQWTKADVPPIEEEQHRPALHALSARMQISYFGEDSRNNVESWDNLGKWYNNITADRRVTTPEITEKVRQLIAGKNDFDSRIRAIAAFMQSEVRYVAIEIGIGGYQPHSAGDVFRSRYGDCKDKATLMSTMLREAGISSDYVIIHTNRGVARRELPSSLFNHAVLAIEVPEKTDTSKYRGILTASSGHKLLLFDPTDEYTPIGEVSSRIQDRYALLVTPAGGESIHTPVLDPDTNRLVRRGFFTLTESGSLSGEVMEQRSGDRAAEWRSTFLHSTDLERTHLVESSVSASVATAKLQNMKLDALDQLEKELVTRYAIATDRYAQLSGPLMLVRPRVIGRLALGLERKQRKYPIEFEGTRRQDDEYEIQIPSGFVIDDVPESVKVESPFGSYESHIKVDGSRITYKRTYIARALEVPVDKIPEFRSFQNRIAEDENSVVVLKKGN